MALGGPSRGRLGRQEASPEAVLGARRPRLGRQEAENVGFADGSSENVSFAQATAGPKDPKMQGLTA